MAGNRDMIKRIIRQKFTDENQNVKAIESGGDALKDIFMKMACAIAEGRHYTGVCALVEKDPQSDEHYTIYTFGDNRAMILPLSLEVVKSLQAKLSEK